METLPQELQNRIMFYTLEEHPCAKMIIFQWFKWGSIEQYLANVNVFCCVCSCKLPHKSYTYKFTLHVGSAVFCKWCLDTMLNREDEEDYDYIDLISDDGIWTIISK